MPRKNFLRSVIAKTAKLSSRLDARSEQVLAREQLTQIFRSGEDQGERARAFFASQGADVPADLATLMAVANFPVVGMPQPEQKRRSGLGR